MLTHYFSRPAVLDAAKFAAFAGDVRKLLASLPSNITIRGRNGVGEPEINGKVVAFNGDAEVGADHEPLVIERTYTLRPPWRMRDGRFHDFCKTVGKPYDLLVVASLYALVHRFAECQFTTDAKAGQLREGFDLFERIVGADGSSDGR